MKVNIVKLNIDDANNLRQHLFFGIELGDVSFRTLRLRLCYCLNMKNELVGNDIELTTEEELLSIYHAIFKDGIVIGPHSNMLMANALTLDLISLDLFSFDITKEELDDFTTKRAVQRDHDSHLARTALDNARMTKKPLSQEEKKVLQRCVTNECALMMFPSGLEEMVVNPEMLSLLHSTCLTHSYNLNYLFSIKDRRFQSVFIDAIHLQECSCLLREHITAIDQELDDGEKSICISFPMSDGD